MPAATTVVIATFNREQMLRETVQSVQRQSNVPAVLVVDDCSSDGTREWLSREPGVTPLLLERRSERAAARNAGLNRVGTEFVLFLDDDDCLLPTAVEHLERAARRFPHAAAVIGGCLPLPGYEGDRKPLNASRTVVGRWWRELLLGWNPDTAGQILFRTSTLRAAGGFDDRFPGIDDFDLLLRLSYQADVVLIPDPVLHYRSHSGQQKQKDASWDATVRRRFADSVEPADRATAQQILAAQDDFFLAIGSRNGPGRRALVRLVRQAPWLVRSPILRRLVLRAGVADVAGLVLPTAVLERLRHRFGR